MKNLDEAAWEAERISDSIKPLLYGHDPSVQGAVLADLLATWLSGFHPPEMREEILAQHVAMVTIFVSMRGEQ